MIDKNGSVMTRGGRNTLIVVGLTVILLILGAMVAWRVVAADARHDVTVAWSGPVDCTGTTVEPAPVQGQEISAIRLADGMRCTLPVRVTNDSRFEVTLTRVRLPYMGPQGGAAVQVTQLAGAPVARPDEVDAVFRLSEQLEPGAAYDFDVTFEFRAPPEGCTDAGLFLVDDLPMVRVLVLGRPGVRTAGERIGFQGTRESDCSS